MAKNEKGVRVKTVKRIIYIILAINVITILVPCRASMDLHRPGFLNIIGDELRQVAESSNFQSAELTEEYQSLVFLSPSILNFGQRPIGMPLVRQVHVHNSDARHSLHLLSISGSSSHFHCSFFEDKLVSPLGNTSFEICFLPKQLGAVDTTLYIHSSRGSFKYKVFGIGVANPYRIRPYVGARVPINSSFSPIITLHNPHMDVLQVEEVFSSAGDLHLELPTDGNDAAKELWAINPFETKSIIRANFLGRVENNHTAYIRIRTNRDNKNEMLVVPVEVEVTSVPGIFSTTELLDFGMMRSFDSPSILPLNLINSGNQKIQIISVYTDPPNEAIHIDFMPVELNPDVHCPTLVANIKFDASKAISERMWQGQIAVKIRGSQEIFYIPYYAHVLLGSLKYNHSQTMFFSNGSCTKDITEELVVQNLFQEHISVYNVSIPQDFAHLFAVTDFTQPVLLRSNETVSLFNITFHPPLEALLLTIKLILHTNLSTFHIPLRIYHGFLRLSQNQPTANKNNLDFGTMAFSQKKALNITVYNENPISIVILKFLANMEKTAIKLVNMEENNKTLLYQFIPEKYKDALVLLKPNNSAMFTIEVTAPDIESTYTAGVIVETQFQHLYIPMHMKVTSGTISFFNDSIVLPFCFPGKISSMELKVTSTFGNAVRIRDILFHPNDTRFYYVPLKIKQSISSYKLTSIGHLYFDMRRDCKDQCYATLPTHTLAGLEWLHDFSLDGEVAASDTQLATQYRSIWKKTTETSTIINITLQLDTTYARGFLYQAQAILQWPNIIRKQQITFPLTQIGNTTFMEITLENPSDVPIVTQIVPIQYYPSARHIIAHLMPQYLIDPIYEDLFLNDSSGSKAFSLLELTATKLPPGLTAAKKSVEIGLAVRPSKKTLALLLQPKTKHILRSSFKPDDDRMHSTAFIIRNNLTIVEILMLNGQGGISDLRLSSRKPGSLRPLVFEMTDKHLKNCESKSHLKNIQPNFTVKRTFTLRNNGQLPIRVSGFSIGGSLCEGYGFKVLDCAPIDLLTNETHKVDIVFTPDFTMSHVHQMLTLETNLDMVVNYSLQVVIPGHMLIQCASILPRPSWEPLLYYTLLVMMAFLIAVVITAGYFEADRILIQDMHLRRLELSHMVYDKSKVFDLKAISSDSIAVYAKQVRHFESDDKSQYSLNNNPLTLTQRNNIFTTSKNIQRLSKLQRQNSNDSLMGVKLSSYIDVIVPGFFQPAISHLISFVDIRSLLQYFYTRLSILWQGLLKIQLRSIKCEKHRVEVKEESIEDSSPSVLREKLFTKRINDKNRKEKCSSVPNVDTPQLAILLQRCNSINEPRTVEENKSGSTLIAQKSQKPRKPKVNELRKAIQQAQLPKVKEPLVEMDKYDDNASTSTESSINDQEIKILQPALSSWVRGKKNKIKLPQNKPKFEKTESNAKQDLNKLKNNTQKKEDNLKFTSSQSKERQNKIAEIHATPVAGNLTNQSIDALEEFVPLPTKKKKVKLMENNTSKQSRTSPCNIATISTPPPGLSDSIGLDYNHLITKASSIEKEDSNSLAAIDNITKHTNAEPINNALTNKVELQHNKNGSAQLRNGRPVAAVGATIRRPWPEISKVSIPEATPVSCQSESSAYDANTIADLLSQMTQMNKLFNNSCAGRTQNSSLIPEQPVPSYIPYNHEGYGYCNGLSISGNGLHESTLMQKLLSDRRNRLLEHRRQLSNAADDWTAFSPGFADLSSSWMKPKLTETDIWMNDTYTPFSHGSAAFNSNINPNIWPNTCLENIDVEADDHNILDPFNTLQKGIWMPTNENSNSSGDWSLFSRPDQLKKL